MDSPAAASFYRTQKLESRLGWIFVALAIFLLFFLILFVTLSIRGHYLSLITSPAITPSFGMMCGLSHTYPFMSGLFFRNPNTPDLVVNVYYLVVNGAYANNSANLSDAQILSNLVAPASWRDSVNTLVWYSENNYTSGVAATIQWAQQQNPPLLPTPKTGITSQGVLNFVQAWVMPLANMALMIAMMASS